MNILFPLWWAHSVERKAFSSELITVRFDVPCPLGTLLSLTNIIFCGNVVLKNFLINDMRLFFISRTIGKPLTLWKRVSMSSSPYCSMYEWDLTFWCKYFYRQTKVISERNVSRIWLLDFRVRESDGGFFESFAVLAWKQENRRLRSLSEVCMSKRFTMNPSIKAFLKI